MNFLKRLSAFVRNNILFVVLLGVFFIAALILGVVRYQTYLDGFDYSVFTQTLWHYSQLDVPRSSFRDVNVILGDHFHPLLVLLTPLFWIWNNPIVLTVVQPVMFALSAIPLYLLAKKHLGLSNALLISTAYLVSHGIQYTLFYDFHEIALAVPLISLLIYAIDTQRYRVVIASAATLCLVKEELILLVAMAGLVLIVRNKKYKLGAALFLIPLIFIAVLTKVIMPAFAGSGKYYAYWTYDAYGKNAPDLIVRALRNPFSFVSKVAHDIGGNPVKSDTLFVLILSSAITLFGSWYALLAVPDIAIRMLSDRGTFYWSYYFHYGAILMPIIFFCFIDVARKLKLRLPKKYKESGILLLCTVLLSYNVGIMLYKNFPFAQLFNNEFYTLNYDVRRGEKAVHAIVGPNASVTAPVVITPHYANRDEVYVLTDKGRWHTQENTLLNKQPNTDYVLINEKLPITDVDPSYDYTDLEKDITDIGYKRQYYDKSTGWIIYHK